MSFDAGQGRTINNLMLHTCSDGSECEFTAELNEDVNTFVPMYDIHRGVHYVSWQCAVCNGASDVDHWDVRLKCIGGKNGPVNSLENLEKLREDDVI